MKVLRLIIILIVLISSPASFAMNSHCPTRPSENKLTLARIMYNFRDFLSDVDELTQKANSIQLKINQLEIDEAKFLLLNSIYCAQLVTSERQKELSAKAFVPQAVVGLSEDEATQYFSTFYDYFDKFEAALKTYFQYYAQIDLNQYPSLAYFKEMKNHSITVREIANEAHHVLE